MGKYYKCEWCGEVLDEDDIVHRSWSEYYGNGIYQDVGGWFCPECDHEVGDSDEISEGQYRHEKWDCPWEEDGDGETV